MNRSSSRKPEADTLDVSDALGLGWAGLGCECMERFLA